MSLQKLPIIFFALFGFFQTTVMAAELLDPPMTDNGTPLNFCNSKAKSAMNELNKETISRVDEIKKLKAEINVLTGKNTLVAGFLKIRDDFTNSFIAIKNQNRNKENNLKSNLEPFKTLLRTSLALSAVNLIANEEGPSKVTKDIVQLCRDAKKTDTHLCQYVKHKWIKNETFSPEIKNLNETLANVYVALNQSGDAEATKAKLSIIYADIPSTVEPDLIFADLMKHSKTLSGVLMNSKSKDSLLGCLENQKNEKNCKDLLSDSSTQAELKSILTLEMNSVQKILTETEIDKFFTQFNEKIPAAPQTVTSLINAKAREATDHLEKQLADKDKYEKLTAIGLSQAMLEEFKRACIQKPEATEINPDNCKEKSQNLISIFVKEKEENDTKIKNAADRLNAFISDNGSLEALEKMKKYVAEKFLRTCRGKSNDVVSSNITCDCLNEKDVATNLPGDASQLGILNSKLSSVIGKLKGANPLSEKKGELGPFSKAELEIYKNYCQNTSVNRVSVASTVCNDIFKESASIANIKETAEWDEFNKKYWVEYSKTSKKGYEVYEKKSNFRILGEGLSQSVNSIYPMWFANAQVGSQIGIMTNQALYQKQMMYMYNPTSPWMAQPYFQGAYFPSTSTNFTQGFNFSK